MSAEKTVAHGAFARWTIYAMAAIGVLGCLGVIAIVSMIYGSIRRSEPPAVVRAGETAPAFEIDQVERVPGTSLIKIEIFATDGRRSGGGASLTSGGLGYRSEDRRNILLLDTSTGKSRRLLPDNRRNVAAFGLLPEDRDNTAPCCYYLLVNGENAVRRQEVILGVLASGDQATVLPAVDGVDSISMPDKDHVALVVRDRQRLFFHFVDVVTLKRTASHAIAIN
ncbi:MAG: hypothetical protein A4S12_07465 [Proteobacteria bacterium SG_bin5]|nr:hypothetical protein [Sphingomonas sp.]OQW42030.1 MAG: hypothetical protein A4S12_07465 [Proteobacteria bacterium SG_bin5]